MYYRANIERNLCTPSSIDVARENIQSQHSQIRGKHADTGSGNHGIRGTHDAFERPREVD
jgi:hypothetical protein